MGIEELLKPHLITGALGKSHFNIKTMLGQRKKKKKEEMLTARKEISLTPELIMFSTEL